MYRYARINMSTGNVRVFDLPRERWMLGGRGLISQVLYTEMNPGADPLSSGNVLVLASGMFAGCPLSCFDSLFLGAKSSSTGQLQILRFMSRGARIMASMDMRFAIIEGRPAVEKQYVLVLDRGRVSLLPATELLPDFREGLGSYALNEGLQRHFGGNACSLVSESGAYPGSRPGVAHIFGKRITRYPKSTPAVVFCIEYAAPPRRYKLRSTWLLSVIVSIRNLSGALVETI